MELSFNTFQNIFLHIDFNQQYKIWYNQVGFEKVESGSSIANFLKVSIDTSNYFWARMYQQVQT